VYQKEGDGMKILRIGILIDDTRLPRFRAEILRELEAAPWCEIALFIKKQKSYDPYANKRRYKLYNMLRRFDAKLFGRNTPYLNEEAIDDMIAKTKLLEVVTQESDFFDEASESVVKSIEKEELDLLLNFGFKHPRGEIVHAAKYGLWEYRHPCHPAAFWEVVQALPSTEVTLERVGEGLHTGAVLGRYRTVTHQKSIRKNYEQIMWRSHMLVVHAIQKVAEQAESYFADKKQKSYFYDMAHVRDSRNQKAFDLQFRFSDDVGKGAPSNCQSIHAFFKLLGRYAKFTARRFFKMDRWIILFAPNHKGESEADLSRYERLPLPSDDYFQADPFIVDEGEKSYLFYEELDYKTLKGYLLVAEWDETTGGFTNPQEILREPYHLSYPNVFKVDDKWYMIPETHENGTVDLYEAEVFPTKWKKIRTMLSDIKAVDATLYQRDGRWWMFVSVAAKEGFSLNDELHLYYCGDFRTDTWKPHPKNPLVTDVTRARPAGSLLEVEGKLIRPAQNCSGVYGRGLVMNEITKLSETEFEERVIQQIRADFADDLVAVHTFNRSQRFTVIDAIKSR
jgi:hypothetical protein